MQEALDYNSPQHSSAVPSGWVATAALIIGALGCCCAPIHSVAASLAWPTCGAGITAGIGSSIMECDAGCARSSHHLALQAVLNALREINKLSESLELQTRSSLANKFSLTLMPPPTPPLSLATTATTDEARQRYNTLSPTTS